MLKQIKLTHYRQHVDRTVDFKPGINAIRGAVEAGKSTVMEAWMYLFFGTKALAEPLEDVVTYDTPISKLKVEGAFHYLGVDYEAYRGKSGAEVSFGREKITGQTEVTKFFESLFKCGAAMASKLMVAEQVKLRGALEDGPKAAGEMIEYLADFDLLDRVIELIQTQLPVGATAGVESRIALLTAQAVDVEMVDTAALEAAVATASMALQKDRQILADKKADLSSLDVVAANQILADSKRLAAGVAARGEKIAALQEALARDLPVAPAPEAIDEARRKVSQQKDLAEATRLHDNLKQAEGEMLWDEPRAALEAEVVAGRARLQVLIDEAGLAEDALSNKRISGNNRTRDLEQAIQLAQMKAIKDSTCAFCQKDLTDVPEVVKINADSAAEVVAIKQQLSEHQEALAGDLADLKGKLDDVNGRLTEQGEECRALDSVVKQDDLWERLLAPAAAYITVDRSVVPARWTWIGPTGAGEDHTSALAALVAQEKAAVAGAAAREVQEQQLKELQEQQATDEAAVAALPIADAQETLDLEAEMKPKIVTLQAAVEAAADAMHLAEGALATAKVANEHGVKQAQAAKDQLALAQKEFEEMGANNVLVGKVRKARPVITNKLWNLTLGATSKYFTDVRGIPSVITRDGVFKCNGKPVAGLSGSAKDSLGLAMRVSLVKTFLPNIPFMMLDEPAAACNAERETNMLGLLSTIGFDQVILITHSDLCESFADHMILL